MTVEFCDRCLTPVTDDKYTFPLMKLRHYDDNDILVDGKEVTLCKECVKSFVKNMGDYAHGKDITSTRFINIQLPF